MDATTFNAIQLFPPIAETSIPSISQSLSVLAALESNGVLFALVSTTATLPLTLTPKLSMTTATALIACNSAGMPIWLSPIAGSVTATSPSLTTASTSYIYITGLTGISSYKDATGTTSSFSSSPNVIIVNPTTSALVNTLTLSNITGNPTVWVAPTGMIWMAEKGNSSTNPVLNYTINANPPSSLINTCFVVSCDLSTCTWYNRSTSTTVTLGKGLLWDNTNTSVVMVGMGSGLGTSVTLNTNVGGTILSGGVVGSDILLQTATSVTKFNSRGLKLWSITATLATLTGLTGHRVFGSSSSPPSQATLTTQTNLGVTTTVLRLPQFWMTDLDPSTGLPLIKSILFVSAPISCVDESLLVVRAQTSSLQQNTGTADSNGNPIYNTISISPSNSLNSIFRYIRQSNIPLTKTYYPSPYTLSNIDTELSIACPHNTWLLQARSTSTDYEIVHLDCDGSVIWRATLSSSSNTIAPVLHPTDTTFALLTTISSTAATWAIASQTIPIVSNSVLIVDLHTGNLKDIRPTSSIPSGITSAAWVTPNIITATTATTSVNLDLSTDRVLSTITNANSPLRWSGGLSAEIKDSYYNLYYRSAWVFQTDATNILSTIEANFNPSTQSNQQSNTTIIYALLSEASLYSYGQTLLTLSDPDTLPSASNILVALNPTTGAPIWMQPIDNAPQSIKLTVTSSNIFILVAQASDTFTVGTIRYSDANTLICINPLTGNINWYLRDISAQNIPLSGGLRMPVDNLLVRTNDGVLIFTPPIPSILTAQVAVDQDSTLAGSQFITNGSRNLVIATTASNQFMQFGQAGCSKSAFSLSPLQLEINAPLSATQKVQVVGGGLEATPLAKITSASPLPSLTFDTFMEATSPSSMTICAVTSNQYIQIGSNSFPTSIINITGTNLLAVVSRQLNQSAVIDFGTSIPISAKLLEASPNTLLVAVDVQIGSPISSPIFYDSRGVQSSTITTTTPAFASSLFLTYVIQYANQGGRLTPIQRLVQVEGSSRTLALRSNSTNTNYVFSGTIATGSAVSSLYITDATGNTTAIAKSSNASYYCKISASGTLDILKTMTPSIADFVLDITGQYIYLLDNTSLTRYDDSGNSSVLTTYTNVSTAFWVSQVYGSTSVVLLGDSLGTLTAGGGFTAKSTLPNGTPLSVLTSNSIAVAVTTGALYAFSTAVPTLPRIWTLTIPNIVTGWLASSTSLSLAFNTNTNTLPQLATFDGAAISSATSSGSLTSASLYRITSLPNIDTSCTITSQSNAVWVAAGMPTVPINLGWAADVSQSTLAALSLTPTATTLNVPMSLTSDTANSGTISLSTPLTVLANSTTYTLPPGVPGQVKVLVATDTTTANVSVQGRTITVSGTTGVKLVYANSTWYQI